MKEQVRRKLGINILEDAPWGTHFCQFYQTKEDLIDILVPYFKAGLENNEFCMWVTSEPLSEEEAKKAMRKAVSNFDQHLKSGQIEIVPHSEWYLKDGAFNLQRVLNAWIDKLDQALAKGYEGIRVTGNTAWLEKRDWKDFTDYEEEINNVIGKYQMIALCSYSLDRCGASEIIDVVSNHKFALIMREGKWEVIESSEHKQAEEALRKSEDYFRAITENSSDIISVVDKKGTITYMSPSVERFLGYKPEELIGKSGFDFILPADLPRAIYDFGKAIVTKEVNIPNTFRVRHKDGSVRVIEGVGKNLLGNPAVAGFVMNTRDITKRKGVVEALQASEENFRAVVENASDGILVGTGEGSHVYVNQQAAEIMGYSVAELIKTTIKDLAHPDELEKIMQIYRNRIEGKPVPSRYETIIVRKDGKMVPIEVSGTKTVWEGKTAAMVFVHDITERKRAEETLRESEGKYRSLASTADSMYLVDRECRYQFMNEGHLLRLGLSLDEVVGKSYGEFHSEEDTRQFAENVKKVFTTGKSFQSEHKSQRDNRYFIRTFSPVMDSQGTTFAITVVSKDITERKQAEKKLKDSYQQLRALGKRLANVEEENRSRLARELHDQLGQSLSVLGINLSFMESELPPEMLAKSKERLAEALIQVEEITERIRDIMSNLRPPLIDDYGLVAALRWLGEQHSKRTGVAVDVYAEDPIFRLPPEVEIVFFRIVQEALANVAKHAHASQARIIIDKTAMGVSMTIADNGVGFDSKTMADSKEPLHWGLMIMRERSLTVGADFRIESEPGKGTRIIVERKG